MAIKKDLPSIVADIWSTAVTPMTKDEILKLAKSKGAKFSHRDIKKQLKAIHSRMTEGPKKQGLAEYDLAKKVWIPLLLGQPKVAKSAPKAAQKPKATPVTTWEDFSDLFDTIMPPIYNAIRLREVDSAIVSRTNIDGADFVRIDVVEDGKSDGKYVADMTDFEDGDLSLAINSIDSMNKAICNAVAEANGDAVESTDDPDATETDDCETDDSSDSTETDSAPIENQVPVAPKAEEFDDGDSQGILMEKQLLTPDEWQMVQDHRKAKEAEKVKAEIADLESQLESKKAKLAELESN